MKLVPQRVTKAYATGVQRAKQNSPHILFGAGIAGVVAGTALACRATLKLDDKLEDMRVDVDEAKKKAKLNGEDPGRDLTRVYIRHAGRIAKLYAPAIVVGGAGIAALSGSHVQLTKRNNMLTAAYAATVQLFEGYRERVREEVGVEKELEIYTNAEAEVTGQGKNKVYSFEVDPTTMTLGHARIFDETNKEWRADAEWNMTFLNAQQIYYNQLLQVRGHVFLNEIYESLGFEHSNQGSVVGWVIDEETPNYIDFGLLKSPRFVNGDERAVILDFNVNGVIYGKI